MARLESTYRAFNAAFARRFPRSVVAYSYKTNYVPYLLRRLHALGAWAEVVSGLEYDLACRLGVTGDRIVFNGPVKRAPELARALGSGSLVHVDTLAEVEDVAAWGRANPGADARVGLRVNVTWPPDAARANRFGLSRRGGDLARAAATLQAAPGLRLRGLHAHLSVPPRSAEQYAFVAAELAAAAIELGLDDELSIDVGGGFGHAPKEMAGLSFPSFDSYADAIASGLASVAERRDLVLITEPGIAVVGTCASYYAPVLAIKSAGGRQLAVVDASVHTIKPTRHRYNLPTTAFDAGFEPLGGEVRRYDLVGYTCMDDDVFGADVELPNLRPGDLVRFDNVGAYTWVFKPPFIRGLPAMYALEPEGYVLVRHEQGLDDFLAGYVW
jgi:diaminopimelate decarboxylase